MTDPRGLGAAGQFLADRGLGQPSAVMGEQELRRPPIAAMRQRLARRAGGGDELEHERRAKLDELATLEQSRPAARGQDARLLDELPILDVDFAAVPETVLRPFFEAFSLEVRYDKHSHHATARVTITDDAVDTVLPTIASIGAHPTRSHRGRPAHPSVTHVVGAPGSVRFQEIPDACRET